MRTCLSVALAAALIATAAPAHARPQFYWYPTEFSACDGYGAPSKYGDGMSEPARPAAASFGNTERLNVELGPEGARKCDAALAAKVLEPYPLRRVSLLRARALHALAAGDTASALKDLEQARALVSRSEDPLFKRTLGLNVDYARAYALGLAGDRAEARALALSNLARRPYSLQAVTSALLVLDQVGEPQDVEAAAQALARLNPGALNLVFDHLVKQGRMAEAVALYAQLAPTLERDPQLSGLGRLYEDARNHAKEGLFWARRGGAYAYALAAVGKPAEARATLAAARARLARDSGPPAPGPVKLVRPVGAREADGYAMDLRVTLGIDGGAVLDRWGELVEARALLAEGRTAEAAAIAEKLTPAQAPDQGGWRELQAALRARLSPAAQAGAGPVVGAVGAMRPDVDTLAGLMESALEPEVLARLPAYGDKGLRSKVGKDGAVTVWYEPNHLDAAVSSEEMALLGAAELALAAGKPGLIVLDRLDVLHIWNGTPNGYSVELKVLFVDPGALPPAYAGARWRVLDAAALRAALAPAYPTVTAEK